tara:strand:- start:423 stop:818 length:396 start_codon:yes stop_codon:yes gene_type:complete
MRILQVLDQAFRTTVEEQDETILWLIQSMLKQSKTDPENQMDLLLTGNAVYYAFQTTRQPALKIGEWTQTQPADISKDLKNLTKNGVGILVVFEDLWDRGLDKHPLPYGIEFINRNELPHIYVRADQIWNW